MTTRVTQLFRQRLLELQGRLSRDLSPIVETVLADAKAAGEHDTGVSETVAKEIALESTEETIHRQVIEAIQRLDGGTFGICQHCHAPIPQERLEAVPYAPYCLRCESHEEQRGRK